MVRKDYSGWSKEELVKEIEKLGKRKKYGIVWEDKPEEVALLCKEKLPVLFVNGIKEKDWMRRLFKNVFKQCAKELE